jgi:uncharacterized membrane-anchored protein YjiN (DUF445 family)
VYGGDNEVEVFDLTELLHWLAGPLIGGLIGWVTNYVAIRMLFRPTRAVYAGRWRVPFTPGVIPRRKDEIAQLLGDAVVAKFWGADDLETVFVSDALTDAFADGMVAALRGEDAALRDLLPEPDEEMKEELCVRVVAAALRADLAKLVAEQGAAVLQRQMPGKALQTFGAELAAALAEPLARELEGWLLAEGRSLVMPVVEDELQRLWAQPLGQVSRALSPDDARLKELARDAYRALMKRHVRPIVETIDVGGIITEKVKGMSAEGVESLVLDVVRKELRYVVWFGALLGVLIGTVNSLL